MLDGLVGRPVLAEPDRVVRPDEDVRQLLERGQAHGWSLVVAEDEEGAVVRAGAAVEGDAVADEPGGELADAEVDVASVGVAGEGVGRPVLGQEARIVLDEGVVRSGEVGRTAPEFGHPCGDRVEDLAGGGAGRDPLLVGVEDGEVRVEALGQAAGGQALEELRALGVGVLPLFELLIPGQVCLASALPGGTRVLEHFGGDRELLIGVEAEDLLGRPHLVLAEGRAMGGPSVLGVRGRPRDDRREADEGRARIGLRGLDGRVEGVDVLGVLTAGGEVDVLDVPAVGLVAGCGVLAEGDGRVVLDGDAVVVPDDEEVRELLGAGQRRGLTGNALLHVPV
ncbi:Uncharacterised protein [Mycobacteroides abscessus subsp. abscessus]|nr:Uncharacterised protein [Mycobacteroides abscessus subsp. abscessus]